MTEDELSSLANAMEGDNRWIFLDGISADDTAFVRNFLEKRLGPKFQWVPLDVICNSFDRVGLEHSSMEWLVVDSFHSGDALTLVRNIKHVLYAFPGKRVLVVGDGNLENLRIPSYLGKGISFSLNREVCFKDDIQLLQHSRLIPLKYSAADLVLSPKARMKFEEAISYINTKAACEREWGFRERHSRGHGITFLFHGASGTGKTMAAEVVASTVGMPLYQVDLSSVVSKWIGETEKNLKAIFRAAHGVKGILLFDEGDALFSKRSEVEGSQDRYSNMEVNFLLQEIESFDGIVILSTNHENAMDSAFLRRFTYSITFSLPDIRQRAQIWQRNIPAKLPLGGDVNFERLSVVSLTGGKIKNCIRHAASRAKASGKSAVGHEDFLWAIKREQQKHGEELQRVQVGEDYWRKVAPEWEYLHLKRNS
jgi:hypothetical protein